MAYARETDDNNEAQFALYNKLSTDWWDEYGHSRGLHNLNKLRIPFIKDGLSETGATPTSLQDINILEVGCGGGILSEPLARTGVTITAIDINHAMIQVAKHHASLDQTSSKLTFKVESIEEHCVNNREKYDAVVASEVLEHVPQQELFLENCVKCLRPGGSLFITTINKTTFSWLWAIIAAEYVFNSIPRGTHKWEDFIEPEKVASILEKCNCKTKVVRGTFYNVLTYNWSWTNDCSAFYALQAVKE